MPIGRHISERAQRVRLSAKPAAKQCIKDAKLRTANISDKKES